ncbi:MAG TPA: replication initiator [Pseudonocardiaceae bacterium]|nr:replication initiator [Pseudonocardiaceae bacterium]
MTTTVPQRGLPDTTGATATAVHRAARPGYRRWLDHVSSVGGCERPIRLAGHLHTINPTTGEVLSSRSTETLPDGVIYVPCGDRRASVCPACAETYRADTYHLIRTGLVGGKGIPDTVATHPVVFATFTAPAFGPVHSRVIDRTTGKVKPCRMRRTVERCRHGRVLVCRQRHDEDAKCVGQPLCPQCYDYAHHVVWNAWASELWRRTTITATRNLRDLAQAHGVQLRLSFAKVAEYQARGLIHFHALIRLDALDPTDPDTLVAPLAGITTADLDQVITRAAATTRVITPPHPHNPDGWLLTWGSQLDIRPVSFAGELTDTAVAGYLAKYATKATEATGHVSQRITTETIGTYANTATHAGRLVRTCWILGRRPDDAHPADWKPSYGRLRRWAHMLGFGGHFATKSRRYSTTRAALKTIRREWRRAHQSEHHTAEETTLVVGALIFAGIGYRSAGDRWFALTVAAKTREQRQIAKEERSAA